MANPTGVFIPNTQSLASHLALSIAPSGATRASILSVQGNANDPILTAASDHQDETVERRDQFDDMYKYVWNALRGDQTIGALDLGVNKIKSGGVEFTRVAANPGGTAIDTLYQDDGTNFDAGTLWWGSDLVVDGPVSLGDPGVEQGSIMIAGGVFDANTKINDIGGAANASLIIHRHSETDGPEIVHTRTHDDTSGHTIVSDDDSLGGSYFAGHDGTDYNFAASILCFVDGAPGANDMPGRLEFSTTQDGANTTTLAMMVDSAQDVHIPNGALLVAGAVSGDGATNAENVVLGDGSGDVGMSLFFAPGSTATIAFVEVAGTLDSGIVANQVDWEFHFSGAVRYEIDAAEFKPRTGQPALGGTAASTRWGNGFINTLYLAGGASGDGVAGAVDQVIGDGADSHGTTVFSAVESRLVFTDGAVDIELIGDHGDGELEIAIGGTEYFRFETNQFRPSQSGLAFGHPSTHRWGSGFINLMHWGVVIVGDGATETADGGLVHVVAPTTKSTITLPTAVAGMRFEIDIEDETATVDLDPAAGDAINGGVAGAVKNLVTAGKYFLYAKDATDWRLHGPIGETA